jgi:hypothetical protein
LRETSEKLTFQTNRRARGCVRLTGGITGATKVFQSLPLQRHQGGNDELVSFRSEFFDPGAFDYINMGSYAVPRGELEAAYRGMVCFSGV